VKNPEKRKVRSHNKVRFARAEQLWFYFTMCDRL